MKKLLLIIDPQNDFVEPDGALPVQGAVDDMQRLVDFINEDAHALSGIVITLDSHHPVHIASPVYWENAEGAHPAPFTEISAADLTSGQIFPRFDKDKALDYLEALEAVGKRHIIWPPHCLYGTAGWAVYRPLYEAAWAWGIKHSKDVIFYTKGMHSRNTEMFSVVKPEVSQDEADAGRAKAFLSLLDGYDKIFVAGEAENFCVKESIADIAAMRPDLISKLVILKQCMSPIPVPDDKTEEFWVSLEKKQATIQR